jgi:hypothetical protein
MCRRGLLLPFATWGEIFVSVGPRNTGTFARSDSRAVIVGMAPRFYDGPLKLLLICQKKHHKVVRAS